MLMPKRGLCLGQPIPSPNSQNIPTLDFYRYVYHNRAHFPNLRTIRIFVTLVLRIFWEERNLKLYKKLSSAAFDNLLRLPNAVLHFEFRRRFILC